MSERYTVVYTDDALADLTDLGNYITENLGEPKTARRLLGRIRDAANTLTSMPKRHPLVDWEPWHQEGIRRMSVQNHSIFYVVSDERYSVIVLRVLYSRMDFKGRYGNKAQDK